MQGLLLEPPALPVGTGPRQTAAGGIEVGTAPGIRTVQGALVGASLAACVVGLLGADAGLVWIVAGAWAVRRVWGRPIGVAWGLACIGAGLRWGTLSLADVEAATRIVAPTVAAGPPLAVVGACVALAAALIDEARGAGLLGPRMPDRLVGMVALLVLVPLFVAPGPGGTAVLAGLGWWIGAGAALALLVVTARDVASRIPAAVPVVLAAAGVIAMGVAR